MTRVTRRQALASASVLLASRSIRLVHAGETEAQVLSGAAARGRDFLAGLFDPALGLLPEFPGAKTYWYFHDNYLAAKVLEASHPELSQRIAESIRSAGIAHSGKIEILFDEALQPLPFRNYELTEVARVGDKVIKTEVVTSSPFGGWRAYADLLLLAAIAKRRTAPDEARQLFDTAVAMWDGHGLRDRVVDTVDHYATYKLALALLAAHRLKIECRLQADLLAKLLAQQNEAGGWITDYDRAGKRLGKANVETSSLAILALDAWSS